MADIAIFRINYKSDFIITLESDAGWATPFCIKFWTDSPQRAFYVQYDGETYTHCAPVAGDPTKLTVQMDDHNLGIGDLKYQIAYHFTVADFPNDTEDEVLNQAAVIIDDDGTELQVMLDLNGETAPEIAFSLPAYAAEAQRIANEEQRIANETQRIANETQRIANEQTRQQNETQRIAREEARVAEFARLKSESEAATEDANEAAVLATTAADLATAKAQLAQDAATLATQKAQLAADKAALADSAATLATQKAQLAQEKATYAQTQGDYAKAQGDYAKAAAGNAKADYVGDDSYVYHWDSENQEYVRTNLYVKGEDGVSAYESAVAGGYEGTEEEFNVYLSNNAQFGRILLGMDDIPTFEELNASGSDIAIGTYCTYNESLYVFTSVHTAGAEWDSDEVYGPTNLFELVKEFGETANEQITVVLQTEDGEGSVEGISVLFTVEGESEPREVLTDSTGRATTVVTKGLLVDIEAAGIAGYYTPSMVSLRASLPQRNVYITYFVDRSEEVETMKIAFVYSDSENENKATSIDVNYDDTVHEVSIIDDVAQFEVPRGKVYTVVFPDVDGYRTPSSLQFTAKFTAREHTVYYMDPSYGSLMWVMNDGSYKNIENVTMDDREDVAGMLIYTSACVPFIIPKEAQVSTGNWLSANVNVSTMGTYNSHSLALTDTDGEANTEKIETFCSGTSYSSGMVTYSRSISLEIGGVTKVGFVPSYAQLYQIRLLYNEISRYFANIGVIMPNITSGHWWSSTQYNATYGVFLTNGSFYADTKSVNSFSVLPVLAY